MAQDHAPVSDVTVTYENDLGGQITITIDGTDFVLSAARARPAPLVRQAQEYAGTIASSIWHQPTDVTTGAFLLATLGGTFDGIAPQGSRNARAVMSLPVEAFGMLRRDWRQLRLELQMLLVYQQTDLRGRMLLASGTRIATGMTVTPWIFSLGGRVKGYALARGAATFALATLGAVYRMSMRMYEAKLSVMDTGPYPFLAAIISGEERIFHLAREIGIDSYFEIRNYLRDHPEAIQLEDTELRLVQKAINWVFDALEDPAGFTDKVEE
ncbi:hypothetical protein M2324_003611 [Rhodovulum sulfidophilum]|uniref:hypothetical protein n=1 Tax=Rhodovulum sulfidophilum TaxID=35806 RepID=UPI0005A8374A|nr:hypothetical protein [Rhodovulum sulfidophilum]ANB33274.1 hypothetical protein A6W98_03790 [Rhodovulum sulfidophilum DSM 1374]ANB37122.1 hypothetical protein A6024_03775 [Rhodovulum sulfidophilum]MCW2305192.1 hypothetical protein [Rhodovulum sulfidophilum]NDK36965.1 hypothetical protein [Rhodovulum sulfidophilum]